MADEKNLVVELFEAARDNGTAWDMAEVPVELLYRAAVEIAELRQARRLEAAEADRDWFVQLCRKGSGNVWNTPAGFMTEADMREGGWIK